MKINFKRLTPTAKMPTRGSEFAAAWDLYADNSNKVIILPNSSHFFTTGIAIEIPVGYFGAIYARSGLATKQGLRPSNCVGVVDSDFRGNISVSLKNDTDEYQTIPPYARIAQIVFQVYLNVEFVEVNELTPTKRGENGFGSTGA